MLRDTDDARHVRTIKSKTNRSRRTAVPPHRAYSSLCIGEIVSTVLDYDKRERALSVTRRIIHRSQVGNDESPGRTTCVGRKCVSRALATGRTEINKAERAHSRVGQSDESEISPGLAHLEMCVYAQSSFANAFIRCGAYIRGVKRADTETAPLCAAARSDEFNRSINLLRPDYVNAPVLREMRALCKAHAIRRLRFG